MKLIFVLLILVVIAIVYLCCRRCSSVGAACGVSNREFLQKMFSEPGGDASFGRGSFGFVILCTMIFIGYQVFTNKVMSLFEWGSFLVMVGGVTYTGKAISTVWKSKGTQPDPPLPEEEEKSKAAGA